jgi:hypothetical protein
MDMKLALYRHTLVEYLTHFAGRPGIAVTASAAFGDMDRRWEAMKADLGVDRSESPGDTVTLTPTGLPPIEGIVDFLSWDTIGVRSAGALYRFYRGFYAAGLGHHLFGVKEVRTNHGDWQAWMDSVAA